MPLSDKQRLVLLNAAAEELASATRSMLRPPDFENADHLNRWNARQTMRQDAAVSEIHTLCASKAPALAAVA